MSLEKRGDFQLGKSKTDDGTGETARVAPKAIDHLVVTSQKGDLTKEASPEQKSKSAEEILDEKS